jgi:hypothetical protein
VRGSHKMPPLLLVILVVMSVGVISQMAFGAVQVNQVTSTATFAAATTLPGTTTITATITSTQFSNATSIVTSTSTQGTQITTVYSTTSTEISSETTISTGIATTSTVTATQISAVRVLSSIWGELLVGLVAVGAIATVLGVVVVPEILATSRRGMVCEECGYRNPPFVKSYCTECGNPLRSAK